MGVSATYTVHCDRCPQWTAEEPTRRGAIEVAKHYGFRRKADESAARLIVWLCPECNPEFCGSAFTYGTHRTVWCLQPPGHSGVPHDWQRT